MLVKAQQFKKLLNMPKFIRFYNFSTKPSEPPQSSESKPPAQPYVYDKIAFEKINNEDFIKKIEKLEKAPTKKTVSYKLALALCLASLFIYNCWQTIPYAVVYKHCTLSENINQNGYVHAVFLSAISFQTTGHFSVYFPVMAYSLMLCSNLMSQRALALFFIGNSLITSAVTYIYEKKYKANQYKNLLIPKCNGASTPLALSAAFFILKPNYCIMHNRMLPFFIVPATLAMYEYYEWKTKFVNELSRPAHFAAIANGLVFGFMMRKLM